LNYLAHSYLSLDDDQIQFGNLIGDFIKGNKYLLFEEKIMQGILLHRQIDFFTDQHLLIHKAISYFKPSFRLSGGIFVDILYDHFLANDTRYFNDASLHSFTADVYANLSQHHALLNDKMNELFSHMATYNWLYNYKTHEGLSRSMKGICNRHPILGDGVEAMHIIDLHYMELQSLYQQFFPELIFHVMSFETK